MERRLEDVNFRNKFLIREKIRIENQLYKKIINSDYYLVSESGENALFKEASDLFKDEEYEKLRLRYEELKSLTNSIY